ncbi:unnamed protein product [Ostreobium quekettii]|uniref:Fe2OG dioxygenase domain-containing protein n=1 Tax=Ostreobium quekettii TaxID=121088 RepID=A0A8S1IVT1_9CHLO|nr:unnamed protein product [Ostreobium quekettii]|eukprot:evm.model.scf_757EXC.5 EVM.evm.TU.scf_757EXC.5   scf_757EXC:34150-38136(+)
MAPQRKGTLPGPGVHPLSRISSNSAELQLSASSMSPSNSKVVHCKRGIIHPLSQPLEPPKKEARPNCRDTLVPSPQGPSSAWCTESSVASSAWSRMTLPQSSSQGGWKLANGVQEQPQLPSGHQGGTTRGLGTDMNSDQAYNEMFPTLGVAAKLTKKGGFGKFPKKKMQALEVSSLTDQDADACRAGLLTGEGSGDLQPVSSIRLACGCDGGHQHDEGKPCDAITPKSDASAHSALREDAVKSDHDVLHSKPIPRQLVAGPAMVSHWPALGTSPAQAVHTDVEPASHTSKSEDCESPVAWKPVNVWTKDRVKALVVQRFGAVAKMNGSAQPAPSQGLQGDAEDAELRAGLRVVSERSITDGQRRQQLKTTSNFVHREHVKGEGMRNVLAGLELVENLLSLEEQNNLVEKVEAWLSLGEKKRMLGRTYTAPSKWMRGKGRRTIQFGCCYNYATDGQGRPPGILVEDPVEDMPPVLVSLAQRLVRWGVLPANRQPDSAIVNVYEPGDCIPPHIDNHDFVRPFVTISLLSTAPINFGTHIQVLGPGDFSSPYQIMLPPRSCLVLKGAGADKAQHCIPSVKERRISITMRQMATQFAKEIAKNKAEGKWGRSR